MGSCETRVVEARKHGEVRQGKMWHSERQCAMVPSTASQWATRRPYPSLSRHVSSACRSSPEVWQREQNTFLGSVIWPSNRKSGFMPHGVSLYLSRGEGVTQVGHILEPQGFWPDSHLHRVLGQEARRGGSCSTPGEAVGSFRKKGYQWKVYKVYMNTFTYYLFSFEFTRNKSKYFVTLKYSETVHLSNLKTEDSKFYLVLHHFMVPLTWGYIYLLLAGN